MRGQKEGGEKKKEKKKKTKLHKEILVKRIVSYPPRQSLKANNSTAQSH